MIASRSVSVRRDGGLAVVTFDSPPLNLFDRELGRALEAALDELEGSPPRAVRPVPDLGV